MHHDPYLKIKKKREHIPIPTVETTCKSGRFIKAEKLESELETNSQPVHSQYIYNELRRKLSHILLLVCTKMILPVHLKSEF